jgi:hypothetical protein
VLEADIRACSDEIGHVALMGRFRARIKDKRVCELVKAFLKAGVMTAVGDREDSLTGTPQGGILSPLLASIALPALDGHFARQRHPERRQRKKRVKKSLGSWRLIRYADSARSAPACGAASCAGCGASTKDAPGWECQSCGGASASPAPGYSQSTGPGSPARQPCRLPATAIAERGYLPRGHPIRLHAQAKPSGQGTRKARCGENRTPGLAGRSGKPTGSNPGRAPRPDPTGHIADENRGLGAVRGTVGFARTATDEGRDHGRATDQVRRGGPCAA